MGLFGFASIAWNRSAMKQLKKALSRGSKSDVEELEITVEQRLRASV